SPSTTPSAIKQFSNFARTGAGLEKILRLIQALATIIIETSIDNETVTTWSTAKSQLALTRRFFRFFNFLDCFERVYALLGSSSSSSSSAADGFPTMLFELGRWTCLGLYFVLEDCTILHAMNVYPVYWNKPVIVEAYKFWFYALALSIVGALWGLLFASGSASMGKAQHDEKKGGSSKERKVGISGPLVKRIVVDGCDLMIPGVFLGWIQVSEVVVGMAMVVSTLVAGKDIWIKAQQA
ncbi:PEX11 domain protein, partial [Aspergillus novofumigatus IBT 16806]